MFKPVTNWLKQRALEKEQHKQLEMYHQWNREDTRYGMHLCKRLEHFLNRLNIIDRDLSIIPLDWPDHEEWMYQCYRDRVNEFVRKRPMVEPKASETSRKARS